MTKKKIKPVYHKYKILYLPTGEYLKYHNPSFIGDEMVDYELTDMLTDYDQMINKICSECNVRLYDSWYTKNNINTLCVIPEHFSKIEIN